MPTNVEGSAIWRVQEAFERALRSINTADGYNTAPVVQFGAQALEAVPSGEFPFVCFEFGDMTPDVEQTGFDSPSHGLIRFVWPVAVFGYVKTSGHRKELYKAGSALLLDVMAAIYQDETLPDANGQGTALLIQPGPIAFDMESFSSDGRGWFAAELNLVFDLERSGTP